MHTCIGEENGNPLQCSCLENPRDRGAWWAASMGSHRIRHDWSDLAEAAAFTFIKRLFSSSSLSAITVVSSAYLRLFIFLLPAIWLQLVLHPGQHFTWCTKLNKQGDNIQPWCTPFPVWNQSVVPCPILTVASWLTYKFLRRQVRWSGIPSL